MESNVRPSKMPYGRKDTEITSARAHNTEITSASEHRTEITSTDKQYDVFISHRGPDTKSTFVSYLCKDLEAAGLQPFLDCKSIDMGEKSWECIENAIKKTPIAVVVFSESFAASEWCLRELDVMLGTPGVKVLPVFYNVRPDDVRFPESGQLRDGFEKLSRRHSKAVMDRWRKRLKDASELMGWEHPGKYKLEAELVSDIVRKVLTLANKALPLAVEGIGVKQVAEEIMETLAKKKEVSMLGLWGMGGIGKSTLARELYNQLSRRYDAACYVEDVTEKVAQLGVVKVQQHIMTDLCKSNPEDIRNKSNGKSIMEKRLCKKRFLLVLDDVRDDVRDNGQMKYLISPKMLAEGSMCIVTSRNRRVFETLLDERKVHTHDVQVLSIMDSERVFTFHAFGGHGMMKPGFEELVSSISKGCGGVPLVLEVCAALLKKEDNKGVWKEVVAKLNQGTIMNERDIFKCLRLSYDALPDEEKDMFLDIACALIGEHKDLAMRAWEGSPELGVRSLMERALIKVDDEGCLRMHNHVRDMGRKIEIGRRATYGITRLWMPEALELLVEKKALPETLRTLNLWHYYDVETTRAAIMDRAITVEVIDLDVSHLTNLRVLMCSGALKIVSSLPKRVHWLRYSNEYTLSSFPRIDCKDNQLAIIEIGNSNFSDYGKSVGKLVNSEVLCLNGCANLTMLSNSFGSFKKLRELKVYCSSIESLPRSFGELSNLEVLDLDGCYGLTKLPDSFGCLVKLRVLKLRNTEIWRLPRSFKDLSNLEVLHLSIWNIFTMSADSFGALKNVQELKLFYSKFGANIPVSARAIVDFVSFSVRWQWRNLPMVPTMVGGSSGGLENARELMVYDFGIESLRRAFREMSNLKVLDLSECRNLSRLLLDSFGGLQTVQKLKFYDFEIQNLPNSIGELSNLEVLDLSEFRNLTMLPDSFGGLKNMGVLWLYCSGIESLPMSFGELSNLEVLDLSWCSKLIVLPDSFGGLKKMRELRLQNSGLQCLPMSFGGLSKLELLDLSWCSNLTKLPNSIGGLENMQVLRLYCSGIESLPRSFGKLSNLEVLDLSCCSKLTKLPNSIGGLKKMQVFWLYCSGIKSLPRSFGELSNLEMLILEECSSLSTSTDSFGDLKKLRVLHLTNELKKVQELKLPNSEI